MKNSKKHKVIFRLSALGDVVLTTGVLNYWAEKHGWEFTVITKTENASILENAPFVKEIVRLEKKDLGDAAWLKKSGEISARFEGHDLIDLHRTLRSAILSFRWKGKILRYPKFGIKRRLFNVTSNRTLEKQLCKTNVTQRYTLAVEKNPPEREKLLPKIFLTKEELDLASNLLKENGINPGFTAIHPYATHPDKAWPAEKWHELISALNKDRQKWVIIGKDKYPLKTNGNNNFTNSLSLRETCAVLKYAKILVTGDSGPMHLAAGVGTPVAAMFGPTCKAWGFYPAGKNDQVIEKNLLCRPCSLHGKNSCHNNRECLTSISVDEILKAIESVPPKN